MAADRASFTKVKNIVYENLNISPTTYGTPVSNKRYKTEYIEDAIKQADIYVMKILLKAKQKVLSDEYWTSATFTSEPFLMPEHDELLAVYHYKDNEATPTKEKSVEISFDMFDMLQEGGIFTADENYSGFYTIQDGYLYHMPFSTRTLSTKGYIKYIRLEHPSTATLYCPDGFEPIIAMYASSLLLMKRADNPEQSTFYMQLFDKEMQAIMSPATSMQNKVNE